MGNIEPIRRQEYNTNNLLNFGVKKKQIEGKEVKLKKDGTPKLTQCNTKDGDIHKVYPFKTEEEIASIIGYYENKMELANTNEKKKIAGRNIMLITIGLNMGIRASDLIQLKWENVFYEDGSFIEEDDEQTIREKKTGKIKNIIFNDTSKDAIMNYINTFDVSTNPDNYLFRSREGGHINVQSVSNVLKEAAKEVGIKRRIGSHTLRKTFALFQIKAHNNDSMFINELQALLNHSSPDITLAYCGLSQEKLRQYHNDVNLGKHCIIKTNEDKMLQGKVLVDANDLDYLFKQLSESCYTCNRKDCSTCMNSVLAKKYGFDLNSIM